jgi:membrane protease YdiL (CAAX protease family)
MVYIISVTLILIWLLLSLILRWKWKKTLATDFPLLLLCIVLLSSKMTAYTSFGEGYQIGISVGWVTILYWLYIRKHDVSFLFRYKPTNLVTGCLLGVALGVSTVMLVDVPSRLPEASKWIPGVIFYSIQKSLAEEIVFRCLLVNYLKKNISSDLFVNLIQGLAFGILHRSELYMQSPILLLLPLGFGLLAGFVAQKQKSIYGSMLAHTLFNVIYITGIPVTFS